MHEVHPPLQGGAQLIGLLLALFAQPAHALPAHCTEATRATDLDVELEVAARAALRSGAVGRGAVVGRLDEVGEELTCLDHAADRVQLARFAQLRAIAAFFSQDEPEYTRWVRAARLAAPALDWPQDTPVPLVQLEDEQELERVPDAYFSLEGRGRAVVSNGRPLLAPEAIADTPHLLQVLDRTGRVVRAEWIDGALFPEDLLGGDGPLVPPQGFDRFEERDRCIGFAPSDMLELVTRSSRLLTDDDAEAHRAAFERFVASVPCLDARIGSTEVAQLLANEGTLRYGLDPDDVDSWLPYVDTAGNLHEKVSIPKHIRDRWVVERPPLPRSGDPLPDSEIYLDGVRIDAEPQLVGMHVLQRRTPAGWESRVVVDGPFPDEWRSSTGPVVARPEKTVSDEALLGLSYAPVPGLAALSAREPGRFAVSQAVFLPAMALWVGGSGYASTSAPELIGTSVLGFYALSVAATQAVLLGRDDGRLWIGATAGYAYDPGSSRLGMAASHGPALAVPLQLELAPHVRAAATLRAGLRASASSRLQWEQMVGGSDVTFFDDQGADATVTATALTLGTQIGAPVSGFVRPYLGAELGPGLFVRSFSVDAVPTSASDDELSATQVGLAVSLAAGLELGGERTRALVQLGRDSAYVPEGVLQQSRGFELESGALHWAPLAVHLGIRRAL